MQLYLHTRMFHKCTQLHTKEMWENTKSVLYFHQISNMTQLILFKVIFIRRFHGVFSILSKLSVDCDFSIPANIRLDEDVLKTSFVFVFKSRLQDVLMETNIFLLIIRRRVQDVLVKTNIFGLSIRLQDVLKIHLEDIFTTFWRRLQNILKTSF